MTPQPQTFAELWRGRMSTALLCAGMACFGLAIGALLIAWLGGWPAGTEHQRLNIVGWALLGALAGMMAVIVSLAIGGPGGRFRGRLSRDGAELEAEDRDDPLPAPAVTATTTTVVPATTTGGTA